MEPTILTSMQNFTNSGRYSKILDHHQKRIDAARKQAAAADNPEHAGKPPRDAGLQAQTAFNQAYNALLRSLAEAVVRRDPELLRAMRDAAREEVAYLRPLRAAMLLDVSTDTLENYVKRGLLPVHILPSEKQGHIRYKRSEILALPRRIQQDAPEGHTPPPPETGPDGQPPPPTNTLQNKPNGRPRSREKSCFFSNTRESLDCRKCSQKKLCKVVNA
jgi:hypothetical protein